MNGVGSGGRAGGTYHFEKSICEAVVQLTHSASLAQQNPAKLITICQIWDSPSKPSWRVSNNHSCPEPKLAQFPVGRVPPMRFGGFLTSMPSRSDKKKSARMAFFLPSAFSARSEVTKAQKIVLAVEAGQPGGLECSVCNEGSWDVGWMHIVQNCSTATVILSGLSPAVAPAAHAVDSFSMFTK
jgi:hypothetical protein